MSPPAARRVSFNAVPLSPAPPTAINSTTSPSSASRPAVQPRKSSLKRTMSQRDEEGVPQRLYTHPDPLLRRLRLRNGRGEEVDLMKELGSDVKAVGFLFAASWTRSSVEAYKGLLDFARWQPHRFKLVYVSVDTDEKTYHANVLGREWLAMEWNDGSNLPSDRDPSDTTPLPPLSRNESFLLPFEPDLDFSLSLEDPTGSQYTRPYSRVFLAEKYGVLGVPNLLVYHTGKRKMVDWWGGSATWGWRMRGLEDRARRTKVWEKWEKGESAGVGIREIIDQFRWIIVLAAFGLAFAIYAQTNREEFEGIVEGIFQRWKQGQKELSS